MLTVDRCRIGFWRGYLVSTFYARPTGGAEGTSVGGPSAPFRWRRGSTPTTEEARLAHRELVARLEADGWTVTGRGDQWYETELSRPRLATRAPRTDDPAPAVETETIASADTATAGATVALPPQHAFPASQDRPPAAAAVSATQPPTRVGIRVASERPQNRWRAAAALGLTAACALLVWATTHKLLAATANPATVDSVAADSRAMSSSIRMPQPRSGAWVGGPRLAPIGSARQCALNRGAA